MIRILLSALLLLSTSTLASNNVKLVANNQVMQPTLVTLGIPVKENELHDINNFSLYNEQGNEVRVFVKETLSWKFKSADRNDIRALKVQLSVDAINSSSDNYTFSFDSLHTKERLAERPISEGLIDSQDTGEIGLSYPKVAGILSSEYLSESGIIPPFYKARDDMQSVYWNAQIEETSKLNLNESTLGNWLFDRVSALYKGCMRTNSADCYKEAYVSAQYWIKNIKKDGDFHACKGGSLIISHSGVIKPCDTKVLYVEPLKIHLALTGDDEWFDKELILAMAELSEYHYWYQGQHNDPYDTVKEHFTERGAGLGLIAQINAYELTYDQEILDRVKNRVQILRDHQLYNPDGYPSSGLWRHSFIKHEGTFIDGVNGVYGYDSVNDRMFSPWMTENIIDGLWQAYVSLEIKEIPEMIRYAGEGMVKWGFHDSEGYINKFGRPLLVEGREGANGCNTTKSTLIYIGSSVIDPALLERQRKWYTDSHNPEIITLLSLAYHFETDQKKKDNLTDRINSIGEGYMNETCGIHGLNTSVRKFNWNNRSNYWGTYLWVLNEAGELEQASGRMPQVSDDFNADYLSEEMWGTTNNTWYINNNELETEDKGIFFAYNLIESTSYEIESDLFFTGRNVLYLVVAGDENEAFYSLRIKEGMWGGIYLVKHYQSYDLGGKGVYSHLTEIPYTGMHNIKASVKDGLISVSVDDSISFEYDTATMLYNNKVGYLSPSKYNIKRADNFKVENK